jgi:hypothetical protein
VENIQENLRARQARFLGYCLEVLEEGLCGNKQELPEFYRRCISYLGNNEQLPSSKLAACDAGTHVDRQVIDKTYRRRLQKLAEAIEANRNRFQSSLLDYDLRCFPTIRQAQGGGAKNESYFYIDIDKQADEVAQSHNEDTSSTTYEDNLEDQQSAMARDSIRYITEKIRRAPWYLRIISPLFRTQESRAKYGLGFLAFLLIVGFILPAVAVYFFHVDPSNPLYSFILALWFAATLLLSSPSIIIMNLLFGKIALVETLGIPFSSVCISEITNISTAGPLATERQLTVLTVSADCPICDAQYGLKKSIMLELKGFFFGVIVGKCINNPNMHCFSFDKDLMTGDRIRMDQ